MSLSEKSQKALSNFIEREKLPAAFMQTVEQYYLPLLEELRQKIALHDGTYVLGIHGCQGSGKSTLAALLVLLLQEQLNIRSINLSLDDFYLTRSERKKLAADVHPLLITRGVPGTHDIALALQILAALKQNGQVAIPRFNKAIDDRASESAWPLVESPLDIIIIEGWCLGIGPQNDSALLTTVNALEAKEDKGEWRTYVNNSLAGNYQDLFAMLDMLIMLKAPDFSNVIDWRLQQEEKLREKSSDSDDKRLMNKEELIRFISHYERLTRHALKTVPALADVVFQLNDDQSIQSKLKG